jgi:hypothetical protein
MRPAIRTKSSCRQALKTAPILAILLVGCSTTSPSESTEPLASVAPIESAAATTRPAPKPTAKPARTTTRPAPKPAPTTRRAAAAPPPAPKTDPQFSTCKKAKAAGYGPYVQGEDPEYAWYKDADSDGTVCE